MSSIRIWMPAPTQSKVQISALGAQSAGNWMLASTAIVKGRPGAMTTFSAIDGPHLHACTPARSSRGSLIAPGNKGEAKKPV